MQPGGIWSNDYLVAPLADLDMANPGRSKKMRVFRVREVIVPNEGQGFEFPLKEAADRAAGTVSRVAADAEPAPIEAEPQDEGEGVPLGVAPEGTPPPARDESRLPAGSGNVLGSSSEPPPAAPKVSPCSRPDFEIRITKDNYEISPGNSG